MFKAGDVLEYIDIMGGVTLLKFTGERYREYGNFLVNEYGSKCLVHDSRLKDFKLVKPRSKFYLDI